MEKQGKGPERNGEQQLEQFLTAFFPLLQSREREKTAKKTRLINRKELGQLLEKGETMETLLQQIVQRGYFLHGSPYDLEILEPRQAGGIGEESKRLKAIYATDSVPMAMFRAIISNERAKKLSKSAYSGWNAHGEDERVRSIDFFANQPIIETLGDGYIYVLKGEDFIPSGGGDFIRKEAYVAPAKISVKKEDFTYEIETVPEPPPRRR